MSKEIPTSARIHNQIKANNQSVSVNGIGTEKVSDLCRPDNKPPDMVKRMIELCSDLNLTLHDVDRKMMEEFPILVEHVWPADSEIPSCAHLVALRFWMYRRTSLSSLGFMSVNPRTLCASSPLTSFSTLPRLSSPLTLSI